MTQKEIITELKSELAMRRKVWKEIPGNPGHFASMEHTRRFAVLQNALTVFETMYGAEFQLITNRAERLRAEADKQGKMF